MSKTKEENGAAADGVEYEVKDRVESEPGKCAQCTETCLDFLSPVLAEKHPPPPQPDLSQRLHYALLCPPHGRIGAALFVVLVGLLWWGVLYAVTGDEALPGGNFFSLAILFILCWCGGYVTNLVKLPPLLGMLLVGGVLGNVPGIDFANDISHEWSSGARQIALAIILIRAGLGLDPAALRRLSFVVLRLAFCPCLSEAFVDGIAAHLILGFPWQWGFMLGFIIAAVSPAVVVPSLLGLAERGYGLDKGIPTLILAAASLDDVLSITGFGVLLGITFSTGHIAWNLAKGPLEAVLGILYGIVGGVILWYVPQTSSKHRLFFRTAMLMGGGLLAIFGSKKLDWSGVGPLGCLTLAFVAALKWRQELPQGEKNPIENIVGVLWMIFQPLLFGLIGAAVRIDALSGDIIGQGIAVLCIGLVVRMFVSYLSVLGTNLNLKEHLFVPIAWMPKATVQAAIGAVAYDMARERDDDYLEELGMKVLMMAVLVIVITAPIGAVGISLSGPRMLKCTRPTATVEVEEPPVKDSDSRAETGDKLLENNDTEI